MGVRQIDRFLEQWPMDARNLHRRLILAPTPREQKRWHTIWLLAQSWTTSGTAEALERDPHTIGRRAAECRFRDITKADCPERVKANYVAEGETHGS